MPIPDEVQTRRKAVIDLALFGLSIRNVGTPRSNIRSPGAGGFFDGDDLLLNSSEELSASFRIFLALLLMTPKVFKDSVREYDQLAGVTQRYPKRHLIPRNECNGAPWATLGSGPPRHRLALHREGIATPR